MVKKISFFLVLCLIFFGVVFMVKADDEKSIVVLEPNGGEVWEAGKAYRVIWQATGYDSYLAAVICNGETVLSRYNIIGNSFLFNISPNQASKSQCKAVVAKSDIGDLNKIEAGVSGDYSDANFSISGSGVATIAGGNQSVGEYLRASAGLIKNPAGKIYKLIENKKLWLPADVFTKLGYNSADAYGLTQTEADVYPRLKLAERTDSPTVYYLTEGGRKRYIPNSEVFNSYGNQWADVVKIDNNIIDAFPDVDLIRAEGDFKVYKLENGVKRWIKTAETFNKMGYSWSSIAPVNKTEIEAYSEGAEITGEISDNEIINKTDDADIVADMGEIDCGVSEIAINQINFEDDSAMVCLGNSFLNNCEMSKAILNTSNDGALNFEIKEDCVVRIQYGDADQIPSTEQKQYANKYIECPINIAALTSESDRTFKPGELATGIYAYMALETLNPNTDCVGSILE